jgi:probable HAF family extracellular repeat protein
MTSNPKTLFASVLVAAAATGMLFAQAVPRPTHPSAPDQAVSVQRDVSRLRALLNLSSDQQQQAARIYSNAAMANAAVRASLRAARASLASAMKANDTLAITQASNTIGKLRSQLATNNAQAQAAFVKILTPEQETTYRQLASRTRDRSRGRPAGGHFATGTAGPRTSPAAPALPQGSYIITDLGVLASEGDTDSEAVAINNSGIVVGISGVFDISENGYDNQDAFIWTPSPTDPTTGTMSYLSAPSGSTCIIEPYFDPYIGVLDPGGPSKTNTVVSGINSSGQVVGYSWVTGDGICNHGTYHGFIYSSGSYQDLGLPPGYTLLPPYDTHSFIPSVESEATAINDAGQVVGWATGFAYGQPGDNAWLYDGSYHILGYFPNQLFIIPTGINSQETTVGAAGYFGFAHTGTGPFLPSDQLGTLGGATGAAANGINNSGMIVGNADTASGSSHAFLLQSGNMMDWGDSRRIFGTATPAASTTPRTTL